MYYVGIDIGSTAAKVVVLGDKHFEFVLPTGWNGKETAQNIQKKLFEHGVNVESEDVFVVSTGYGRISVAYADKEITEITCHGRGASFLAGEECFVIDVGGQDTKVILLKRGKVFDFLMNDKCSAGTGKFIEVMANRLGVTIEEFFYLAKEGKVLPISSLCTVFAESEIIGYITQGKSREDIASGIIDSVANKVAQLAGTKEIAGDVVLTGGLSDNSYFSQVLSQKLGHPVKNLEYGKYAGALGAALLAKEKVNEKKKRGTNQGIA